MTIKALYPTVEPSLELDFANTKALDPRISFARASTGTYVGADGLIKAAASGVARFDHSTTGESLGLLVEEGRTNYVPYSEQFDNALWIKTRSTVSGNTIIAPDGKTTADAIVEDSVNNNHFIAFGPYVSGGGTTFPTTAGADYVVSIFVKRGAGSRNCFIYLKRYTGTAYGGCFFNFDTEVLTVNTGKSHKIDKFSNGWYRISFVGTVDTTGTVEPILEVYLIEGTSNFNYQGNGASSIYLWGAQVELGSVLTSYIPTGNALSGTTRAADVASVSNANSSIFSTSAFTTINSPFGTAGGSSTLGFAGPVVKRTSVYNGNLSSSQINTLTGTSDFWRWRVTGSTFALPNFFTDGNVTVDWNDGVVETLTTGVHTFVDGKTYHDIGFRLNSGTYFGPSVSNNGTYANRVVAVGPTPASMKINASVVFSGCVNLKIVDATLNLTGGTNFTNAWFLNYALSSLPVVDTSTGTNFTNTWYACVSLTSFPLINISTGSLFYSTWVNCQGLTSFPLLNFSSATVLEATWNNCTGLTSFPLINTSNVTNFNYTWNNCFSLTSFPLINTAAGTVFFSTWLQCYGLTSFPALNFSAGTDFRDAWRSCSSLSTFPPNMFNTTGSLISTAFGTAFTGCALTAISIENILTSLVTNGRSNITLDMAGGTNAGASTWTAPALSAYATLVSRGWTITRNA